MHKTFRAESVQHCVCIWLLKFGLD